MSVEKLLSRCLKRGFYMQQAWQRQGHEDKDYFWQVTLVVRNMWDYARGQGNTFEDALEAAYEVAKDIQARMDWAMKNCKTSKEMQDYTSPRAALDRYLSQRRKPATKKSSVKSRKKRVRL